MPKTGGIMNRYPRNWGCVVINKDFNFMSMRFEGIKKIFLYFVWLILSPLIAYVQKSEEPFPFTHIQYYGPEQGLNGALVYYVTEDSSGFLWFITDNGLNRFDGYSCLLYTSPSPR